MAAAKNRSWIDADHRHRRPHCDATRWRTKTPRWGASLHESAGELVICGGYNQAGDVLSNCEFLSSDTGQQSRAPAGMPNARAEHLAIPENDLTLLVGGVGADKKRCRRSILQHQIAWLSSRDVRAACRSHTGLRCAATAAVCHSQARRQTDERLRCHCARSPGRQNRRLAIRTGSTGCDSLRRDRRARDWGLDTGCRPAAVRQALAFLQITQVISVGNAKVYQAVGRYLSRRTDVAAL